MKKRILFSFIALCSAVFGAMAQRNYTFNAAALNVDGLPNSILGISINPDGKEAAGATELCGILANSGWDIVGFSEDFNFHDYLVAAPASNYYNFGAHGGKVSSTSNSTDGLGFACNKRFTMSGGDKTKWNTLYGGSGLTNVGDNGADGMIDKGFRMYTVTLATGVSVDVYVLHMDANTADSDDDYDSNGRDKNIVAREAQLQQLADAVMKNMGTNKRPVIILGDTNCRYTREAVETGFINYINADARFTIKDAWVEHMWGGNYPTYGAQDMTTGGYGDQKGEVVDKVFYINTTESNLTLKANSYLHDTNVKVSDHYPVVVNFTLTDPNGTAVDNNSWQVNGGAIVEDENMLDGCQVTDGTTYFIKNVSTGLYLKSGATWGTQACEGSAGMPITVTLSDGKYRLGTLNGSMSAVYDPYMDNGQNTTWTLQEVEGAKYQYYLRIDDGRALSSTGEDGNILLCKSFNADDDKQKWVLLTEERMKEEMANATASKPFDITPLLKAASFDRMDFNIEGSTFSDNASTNWPSFSFALAYAGDATTHNGYAYYNNTAALTVSQTLKSMPAGTYTVSFEGFYRATTKLMSTSDKEMAVPVSFGGSSVNLPQNKSLGIGGDAQATFRDGDSYLTSFDATTTSQGDMTLKVEKPKYNSGTGTKSSWIALDNFVIKYKGTGSEQENVLSVKTLVANYINITAQKVAQLNARGQEAYDISSVLYRYDNDLISSEGQAEIAMIDKAYEIALLGHKNGLVEEAIQGNGDVSALITNPSFETGDLTGWTVLKYGNDTRVADNLNASGMDGKYLFNTWAEGNYSCGQIYQEVKGLLNGYYTLEAMVASWADRKVYLVGNDQHSGIATTAGEGTFMNHSVDFLVENGVAQIGAVGGNQDGKFYYKSGIFYKVDNFRLTYKGTVGEGRVKIALADAKAKAESLGDVAKAQFDATVAQYENAIVSGDGKAEEEAIYSALEVARAEVAKQPNNNVDVTWLITNPSFETGDWTGWNKPTAWDAVVLHATRENAPDTGDGYYVVNVWNDDANATNSGINPPTYQALAGLPNGHYRLTADVAADGGNQVCVYATVGGQTVNGVASPENNWTFVKASVDFTVTDGKATIGVVGYKNGAFNIGGGCWYKADDFRLTYLAPIAVESVTLSQNVATLIEGNALDLTATVTPDYATDKTVTWSSSDEEVATVDEKGHITAVTPGTVTITATAGTVKATCEVTVEAASYVFTLQVEGKDYFTKTIKRGTELAAEMASVEQPTREGYTFSGWNVPATMPAEDLTLNGTFIINSYLVTFKIGEEVIFEEELAYGTPIVAPEAPEKEGYTFNGWGDVAATVPAGFVIYEGSYTVNKYTVTFKIGDEVISSEELDYGTAIVAPEAPEKEGYTFSGWGDVDATVPVEGATYEGTYTANIYTVTFKIGDEVISSEELAYGTAIVAPEVPEKEGYTFSGWGDVDATVPVDGATYEGTYTANIYTVTFKIGDDVISSEELAYGTAIVAPEAPEKEGYTFDGWGNVDATVPVNGATYEGTYTANIYTVTFKIGDEVISSEELAYGAPIVAPKAPEKEGYTFDGWVGVDATVPVDGATYEGSYTVNKYTVTYYVDGDVVNIVEVEYGAEIPEYVYEELGDPIKDWKIKDEEQDYTTMPAKDIAYTGSISSTGIDHSAIDSQSVIYDLSGRRVLKAVKGFYIINGKKVFVK